MSDRISDCRIPRIIRHFQDRSEALRIPHFGERVAICNVAIVTVIIFVRTDREAKKKTFLVPVFVYEMSCFLHLTRGRWFRSYTVFWFFNCGEKTQLSTVHQLLISCTPIHFRIVTEAILDPWNYSRSNSCAETLRHKKTNAAENCVYTVALKTNKLLRMDP